MTIDYPHVNGKDAPSSAEAHAAHPPRERIAPPLEPHNYLHSELEVDEPGFKAREGLKPIDILQPEGVSFKFDGRTLVWQNWRIHVGFNYRSVLLVAGYDVYLRRYHGREGMVLSHITYDDGTNGTRPLFYRLSVAEMVVPVSLAASNKPLINLKRILMRFPYYCSFYCSPSVCENYLPAPPETSIRYWRVRYRGFGQQSRPGLRLQGQDCLS